MSDLVERLRAAAPRDRNGNLNNLALMLLNEEAATRIEELEAALSAMPQEPVAWPEGFYVIEPHNRVYECASADCGQRVSIRMELGGVGADYCEPCARKIVAHLASPVQGATAPSEEDDPSQDEIDAWLLANCGAGIPHGEAETEGAMLHGLAYVLRQIEHAPGYRPNIGQVTSATSALRMALNRFALIALRNSRAGGAA